VKFGVPLKQWALLQVKLVLFAGIMQKFQRPAQQKFTVLTQIVPSLSGTAYL
jgi:hypothetical protein